MAHYQMINTSPRFLAVDLQRQLVPGTFEQALNHLIDHAHDLPRFDCRFKLPCNASKQKSGTRAAYLRLTASLCNKVHPCNDQSGSSSSRGSNPEFCATAKSNTLKGNLFSN